MTPFERVILLGQIAEHKKFNQILDMFPDKGECRRELYKKHLEFFRAGKDYMQRLFLAANRVGKTMCAGTEIAYHLTGEYPEWWEGRIFDKKVKCVAAGKTLKFTRETIVEKMMGTKEDRGSGLIPRSRIKRITAAKGINDSIDQAFIQHSSGGTSSIDFKSFDSGREVFQGFEADIIWLDEEADSAIVEECITRLATTGGLLILTFTPLYGLSEVVLQFIPDGDFGQRIQEDASRYTVNAEWDDVPHLNERAKQIMLASYLPYQKDARTRGLPSLGSGVVYPLVVEDLLIDPFELPAHFAKCYAFDVGWNKNAVLFGAHDRENDTIYIYDEIYRSECEPSIMSQAIKARGEWISGVIDPAARGRSQIDGRRLIEIYRQSGLMIEPADNSVEAGILKVWEYLSTGRLKIFSNCVNLVKEMRIYRRDEKGRIVKANDHLMDCCVVGDTIVNTENGNIKIKDLIGKKGKVISRDGSLLNFIGARLTIKNSPIMELKFSNGDIVKCTPDHPFLTEFGWVEAKDMINKRCYNGVSQRKEVKSCISKLYQKLFKNSETKDTTNAGNIFKEMGLDCTELYGNSLIKLKYLKDFMFTILTTINLTITQKTFRSKQQRSILENTCLATQEDSLMDAEKKQTNGMDQKKVKSGIRSILKNLSMFYCKKLNLNATNAGLYFPEEKTEGIDSARTNAKQETDSIRVLIMKNALAWLVAKCLLKTVIALKSIVKKDAKKKLMETCVSALNSEHEDVYCLTVPSASAFCIASGLVVHNTRYLVLSGLTVARVKSIPKNKTERLHHSINTDSWLGN